MHFFTTIRQLLPYLCSRNVLPFQSLYFYRLHSSRAFSLRDYQLLVKELFSFLITMFWLAFYFVIFFLPLLLTFPTLLNTVSCLLFHSCCWWLFMSGCSFSFMIYFVCLNLNLEPFVSP